MNPNETHNKPDPRDLASETQDHQPEHRTHVPDTSLADTQVYLAPPSSCSDDQWQEHLCAFVDGELDCEAFELVGDHLQHCGECQETLCCLGSVDRAVVVATMTVRSSDRNNSPGAAKWWRWMGRAIPFAAAASMLGVLAMIAFWPSQEVNADEITEPIIEVQMLQLQKQAQQDLMLDVMQYQLRALQHELTLLKSDDAEKALQLADSIEQLLEQVTTLQRNENSDSEINYE